LSKKYDYAAIIIGAGISGLVCGCYLAKAGMKTLIVEKNAKPGGYCTSFKRGGFSFDACVHSLGSLREGGNLRIIIQELGIEERLKITRYDPSDIIVSPDFKIHFWNDLNRTIQEFQGHFPNEADNIKEFFNYIKNCGGTSIIALRSITFQTLLDRFFNDKKLKGILSLPVLGNASLPAEKISAFVGAILYKEFMLDGGYYPNGSIQALADVLTERYKEFGGEILFSAPAKKIKMKDNMVDGIELGRKGSFSSKFVISNADAKQTLLNLVGDTMIDNDIIDKLETLEPSLSMFLLYLGLNKQFSKRYSLHPDTNLWFLTHYDVNKYYVSMIEGDFENLDPFLIRLSSNNSMLMLVNAPFKDEDYWNANKRKLIDVFIRKIERIIPELSSYIEYKDAATPNTLFKWTLNYAGAAYGWAGIPSQLAVTGFTQKTYIENLYLTGHWTTLVQGVGGVAYLGRDTSARILKKETRA
jgi:prolycopene isomerase